MSTVKSLINRIFGKKSEFVYFPHLGKSYLVDELSFTMISASGYRLFSTPDGHTVSDNGNAQFEIFFA